LSVAKPSRINGILVQPSILQELIAFDRHKEALLTNLREAFERRPQSKPFDTIKPSRDLTVLAKWYFEDKRKKRQCWVGSALNGWASLQPLWAQLTT
jgi:hypothetical protein